STTVSAAPTASGGTKLKMNLRTGGDQTGRPAVTAFRHIARMPMAIATAPSVSHVASHATVDDCCTATMLATIAVTPIATPPQPGTAVNEPARSMVSRMYRRLSMA